MSAVRASKSRVRELLRQARDAVADTEGEEIIRRVFSVERPAFKGGAWARFGQKDKLLRLVRRAYAAGVAAASARKPKQTGSVPLFKGPKAQRACLFWPVTHGQRF
jgi:hypothetical protein